MPRKEVETWLSFSLTIFEGVGRMGVFVIPPPAVASAAEIAALIGMLASLLAYYVGWIRFFGRREHELFSPTIHITVPLAISPITRGGYQVLKI